MGKFLPMYSKKLLPHICFVFYSSNANVIEIERKFKVTEEIMDYCRKNMISSKLIHLEDTYFDNSLFDLTKRDMWMRKRNAKIELKWPQTFLESTSSQSTAMDGVDFYIETTNSKAISEAMKTAAGLDVTFKDKTVDEDTLKSNNIHPFGTIITQRQRFFLKIPLEKNIEAAPAYQNVFIDIDNVKYGSCDSSLSDGYTIGEIEFCNDLAQAVGECASEGATAVVDKAAQERIMKYVFGVVGICPEPVLGKVLHFLHQSRPDHFAALRESGLLASKGIRA